MTGRKRELKDSYKFGENQLVLSPGRGDGSDPGFMIKGYKLRWLSHTVQTFKPGRIWQPLRVEDLDPAFVQKWMPRYNHLAGNGDGTIRRREMVLSYASQEAVDKERRQKKNLQALQEGSIRTHNRNKKAGVVTDVEEVTVRVAPEGI